MGTVANLDDYRKKTFEVLVIRMNDCDLQIGDIVEHENGAWEIKEIRDGNAYAIYCAAGE